MTSCLLMACNLSEDEPPETTSVGTTGLGPEACFENAQEQQLQCVSMGMQWIQEWDGLDYNMLLIDDPKGSVGVGGGVLINVSSSADYVGNYQFDGGSCTIGCGWCQPGQSFCFKEFDDDGFPVCGACIEPGENAPAICEDFLLACQGTDPTGADTTGSDESSGAETDGADTSGGVLDDEPPTLEYECAGWDSVDAVSIDGRGVVYVDPSVVEEIATNYGDPLALCEDTRFSRRSDGHYEISRMSSTGVLAQMGLRPGDVVLYLDGEVMSSLDAVARATADLFYDDRPAGRFTLTIQRGRQKKALNVVVR